MDSEPDETRERSRKVWNSMAQGWETSRQDLWEFSRPVSEWLIERLDPRPEAQAKVRARLDDLAQPFRAGDGYAFPVLCLNVTTRKPA